MDPLDDRARDPRSDELPDFESDEDVDSEMGGGLTAAGATALDRGAGQLSGIGEARGRDEDAATYGTRDDANPLTDDAIVSAGDQDR